MYIYRICVRERNSLICVLSMIRTKRKVNGMEWEGEK